MLSAVELREWNDRPLVMVTAYDYHFARLAEESGADLILVGDSLANVMLGLPHTRDIGMPVMEIFVGAVCRGAPGTHVVADMPFGSDRDPEIALTNGRRFQALGAQGVKLEGEKYAVVEALISAGIPVMGHLGLLPQTATSFKQVGHAPGDRRRLVGAARRLEDAGVYSIVLEHLDFDLAADIADSVTVPTIGIGAGRRVGGQVLVLHDLIGLNDHKPPPFAKRFAEIGATVKGALEAYGSAVREGAFPPD